MPRSTVVPSHLFASRPGRYSKSKFSRQQLSVCDCGKRLAISKPGARARRQVQAGLLKGLPVQSPPKVGDECFSRG